MRIKRGTRARFNLTDGSVFEGTVRFCWYLFCWKISDVVTYDVRTDSESEAQGWLLVPKRSVLFVQVAT